jgi:hypothetical protein
VPFPIVITSHGLEAEFALLAAAEDEEEAIRFSTTQPPQSPVYDDYIVLLVHQSNRSVS